MKYFIYARKSTDSEERQILSIESQLSELKEFAAKPACRPGREKLEIVASLCEAQTAKEPGRKIFGEMLDRICAGEASGILACFASKIIFTTAYLSLTTKFIKEATSQLFPRNFLILFNKQ